MATAIDDRSRRRIRKRSPTFQHVVPPRAGGRSLPPCDETRSRRSARARLEHGPRAHPQPVQFPVGSTCPVGSGKSLAVNGLARFLDLLPFLAESWGICRWAVLTA